MDIPLKEPRTAVVATDTVVIVDDISSVISVKGVSGCIFFISILLTPE